MRVRVVNVSVGGNGARRTEGNGVCGRRRQARGDGFGGKDATVSNLKDFAGLFPWRADSPERKRRADDRLTKSKSREVILDAAFAL